MSSCELVCFKISSQEKPKFSKNLSRSSFRKNFKNPALIILTRKMRFLKKVWNEPFCTIFLLIIFNVAVVELNAFFNLLLNNRIILLFDKNCHFNPKMKNNGQTKTINVLKIRKIINYWSISTKILLRS